MVKTIIAACFAAASGYYFAGALEKASATRAKRRDNIQRRSLVLGKPGKIAFAVFFALIVLFVAWMSKFTIPVSIVGLGIAAALVLGNTYLKGNGIECFASSIGLWAGVFIGSSASNVVLNYTKSGWGKWYMIIQIIAGILITIGSIVGFLHEKGITFFEENEDEETVQEDVKASSDEESEDEESKVSKDAADDSEGEDEDDGPVPFDWNRFYRIGFWILLIGFVIYFGYRGLDAAFDLFPPYIN